MAVSSVLEVVNEIVLQNVIPKTEFESLKVVYSKQNTNILELRSYYLATWISRTGGELRTRWQLFSKHEYNVNMVLQEINRAKGRTAQHYTKFNINLKKYNRKLGRRLHERNYRILQNSI